MKLVKFSYLWVEVGRSILSDREEVRILGHQEWLQFLCSKKDAREVLEKANFKTEVV